MQPRPRADTVKPCWPSLRVGIGVLDILRSLSDLDYCIIKRPFREYGTSSDSLHLLWTSSCNDTRERSTMNQNGTSSPTAYSAFDWPGRRWHRPGLALDAGEACSHPCNDAGASLLLSISATMLSHLLRSRQQRCKACADAQSERAAPAWHSAEVEGSVYCFAVRQDAR